ncbi:GYD domain-containing protein [Chloroflexota bacterium]
MARYIMLTTLTDEGRRAIKMNPERIREVSREVESMGVKVLAQYAVLGPYDFVNILDAPNNEAVSKMAMELGSRGTLQTMTMAAMDLDDFIKSLTS